jgi:hypothetical protein
MSAITESSSSQAIASEVIFPTGNLWSAERAETALEQEHQRAERLAQRLQDLGIEVMI